MFDRVNERLTLGLDLTLQGYAKNLSYYTVGHGGYFSPEWYVALQFPLTWSGRSGNLSYRLSGSLGWQSFREESADYYPDRPDLQSQLVTQTSLASTYAGNSVTGLMFNLDAGFEYRLAPQFFLGGQFGFEDASNYNEFGVGLYLRYWFDAQGDRVDFPPRPLKPFAQGHVL